MASQEETNPKEESPAPAFTSVDMKNIKSVTYDGEGALTLYSIHGNSIDVNFEVQGGDYQVIFNSMGTETTLCFSSNAQGPHLMVNKRGPGKLDPLWKYRTLADGVCSRR